MNFRTVVFRFRVWIFAACYVLGFLAPWERYLPGRGAGSFWLAVSALLTRTGWMGLAVSTNLVTIAALYFCAIGAGLRVWGTAYLSASVVQGSGFHGDRVVEGGPYHWIRNPLYLGSLVFAFGVAVLMPVTGALFFLVATYAVQRLLISSEETFLSAQLGEQYRNYCRRVPRLVPRFLPRIDPEIAESPERPEWLQATLGEIYPLSFTLCFAVFAWRFNALILIKCLLICFGLSLIVRALWPPARRTAAV